MPHATGSAAPPARPGFSDALGALVVAAALILPFVFGSAGITRAAPAEPSLDERWAFDELNARRRASGARPLAWDALAYEALRGARLEPHCELSDGADRLGARVRARRELDLAWTLVLRCGAGLAGVTERVTSDADLLARRYTQGALALQGAGDGERRALVAYACEMPPLLRRATLDGPAGTYRVRCPNCRREQLYRLDAPRGHVSIDCPACGTLMTPHLEDLRGALRWPTWYVRPWAPFALDNPFLAWKWVNEGVLYDHPKADRDLYGWQTPQETARLKKGVCRDTAVMLAAWLREMGREALVVTGQHGGRHAWVVLNEGGTRYLLESTYDGPLGRRYPPRLELATDYLAQEMMFDDRRVLLNRGQQPTRDYDSPRVWFPVEELP